MFNYKKIKKIKSAKPKKGLSLIEIIVVVAIIGILASVAVVALNNSRVKSRDAKRVADVKQIQTALQLFFANNQRYPSAQEFAQNSLVTASVVNGQMVTTTYMAKIPTPPTVVDGNCSSTSGSYSYDVASNGSSYTISYCVAAPTGSIAAGVHCATPNGLDDTASCAGANNGGANVCTYIGDSNTCANNYWTCGSYDITDNCSQARNITCGSCAGNQTCTNGTCVNNCVPNCSGKCGGTDGCSGTCTNNCSGHETCGGGGTQNVCGCTAVQTQPSAGTDCRASLNDNCGGTYTNNNRLVCDSSLSCDQNDGVCKCGGAVCGGGQTCSSGSCVTLAGDQYSCPDSKVVQYDGGPYDSTGLTRNQGGYYRTVKIGNQCWLRDNLNAGTMISSNDNQINNSTVEKYCYSNTSSNCDADGGLYQWDEVMKYSVTEGAQGICPTGWHIPSDAEQNSLDQYLTDSPNTCNANRVLTWECANAGSKLQVGGTSHFEKISAGYRYLIGSTGYTLARGALTYFWSSTVSGSDAWIRDLGNNDPDVLRETFSRQIGGFSVRCIKN
ncbi:MAG: fibrobacter succinogenes major paralogous domain-containing protein [Candidatus Falkowbacteria bacterium]